MKTKLINKKATQFLMLVLTTSSLLTTSHIKAAVTINTTSDATFLAGTGSLASLNAGDVIVFNTDATDGFGTAIEVLATINSLGTSNRVRHHREQLSIGGTADAWFDLTLSFIIKDSVTPANPMGLAIALNNVSSFTAFDIDSNSKNFTDVFGLYDPPGSVMLDSSLENKGFIGTNSANAPTDNIDYARAIPASIDPDGSPNWTRTINYPTSSQDDYTATWNYPSSTINSFRLVWGFTSADDNVGLTQRGFSAAIGFSGTTPIPEPSNFTILGLGLFTLMTFRNRN